MRDQFKAVIDRHPLPWRVTPAYREWLVSGGHAANPPAIVDALYREDVTTVEDAQARLSHIVITSSEWLDMDFDVAELIVATVNGEMA